MTIDVKNLTATYGELTVLKDISFTVEKENIFVVLGGSGCGKTTLLKHMLGLLKPASGAIKIFGVDITKENEDEMKFIRQKIGMVFQGSALFNSMTLAENVALPLEEYTHYPPSIVRDIVDWKLETVNLYHARDYFPAQLSGGMKKRAAIARAMVLDPELLFFDEHTTGLDPVMAAELDATIMRLRNELDITVVVVTHDMTSIRRIADEGIMLASGEIVARGSLEQMETSQDPTAVKFFNSH